MATLIKDAALAYVSVLDYMEKLPAGHAVSINEITEAFKNKPYNIKGSAHITDIVRKHYSKGLLKRNLEGKKHVYWATTRKPVVGINPPTFNKALTINSDLELIPPFRLEEPICKQAEFVPTNILKDTINEIPEIKITNSGVYISHPKYKLTLDFS